MIIQALSDYYRRKSENDNDSVAPEGWEFKEIPFLIVIDSDGVFQTILDTREGEGRKKRARAFLVPQGMKKTVNISSNLLWDNVEYVLGANPRDRNDIEKRHSAFKERIRADLQDLMNSPPVSSVSSFLEKTPLEQIAKHPECGEVWKELLESNSFITFKVDGIEGTTIFDSIRSRIRKSSGISENGICLVSGEHTTISRLHPAIKGVRGTNTSGGALVAFNLPAFNSFGKAQNYNAPIGESAAFSYTTALNMLLGKDSRNKTSSGDATIVFWAEQAKPQDFNIEDAFGWFVESRDDPDRGVRAVRDLYDAVHSGAVPLDEGDRFYVLGLSPNAARISVRFWRQGSVREIGEKILRHFDDIQIVHSSKEPEHLSLNQILRATALEYKMDNVRPNLAGAVITSMLDGTPYPRTLMQECIRRVRAEQNVNRSRAGILKAFLNRAPGVSGKEKILVSLDRTNTDIGYRLGRLFAVLEKIQEEANPGINATIRDRFYGAASSSPVAVFSQLLKLKNYHLSKLGNPGRRVNFEKEIMEVMSEISGFPGHLTLDQQAYFAIGYYHQRQDFFTSKTAQQTLPNI